MANYYEILEVAPTAAKKEIKKSYYRLSKQYHPDHNPGDAAAEEKFKAVGKAYSVLSDDVKRKEYDEQLAAGSAPQPGTGGGRYSRMEDWQAMEHPLAVGCVFSFWSDLRSE